MERRVYRRTLYSCLREHIFCAITYLEIFSRSSRSIDRITKRTNNILMAQQQRFCIVAKGVKQRVPFVSSFANSSSESMLSKGIATQPGANPTDLYRESIQHPRGFCFTRASIRNIYNARVRAHHTRVHALSAARSRYSLFEPPSLLFAPRGGNP